MKADDPPLELPKIPTNFSEVWNMMTGLTKEQSVSDKAAKVEEKVMPNDDDVPIIDVPQSDLKSYPESQLDTSADQCNNHKVPKNEEMCEVQVDICKAP